MLHKPPKRKKMKVELCPIVFGLLKRGLGKLKLQDVRILIDSGASKSIISKELAKGLRIKRKSPMVWSTMAGKLETSESAKAQLKLLEFDDSKVIEWNFHVTPTKFQYDLIIGRDLLSKLGMIIDFENHTMSWDGAVVPMKSIDATVRDSYFIHDSYEAQQATKRTTKILDAKYEKADLEEVAKSNSHLSNDEREKLLKLLKQYETLFDGTLGRWRGGEYDIELKENAQPYHARSFPVPKIHEETLKTELQRLCSIGVLKKVNRSEWAAPIFIIPKKNGTVRFINDFRELNKRIKRKPFPIPKIQDLLMKLEGFRYGTSLDLKMGYYHIELSPNSKRLCTIVTPWGKYECQRLPMGLCNSPDIFQERMSTLMDGLEFVRTYIDDLLVLTKGSWDDHLTKLEAVLKRLLNAGLKVNARKSFFGQSELEYLGYWISREGIQPITKKVDAIINMAPPTTTRDVRRFVGMVNYYRDMWIRRSDVLAPLTKLCSTKTTFEWRPEQQKAFDMMKNILSREVMLAYPNFGKPFDIHTDASKTQLGAVISQEGKPIAFYSRKLNDAQTRYTTTERELLAIVETLKEYRNILLGHEIRVYTDHKNLTYKNFNTDRVMRWRLVIEEYGPELIYLKGERNIVADALSRLGFERDAQRTENSTKNISTHLSEVMLSELWSLDSDDDKALPEGAFPLTYKEIMRQQQKDAKLLQRLKTDKSFGLISVRGGGKERTLVTQNDKIYLPRSLQKRTIEWYHNQLCHPGVTRTEATIRQHFTFPKLSEQVKEFVPSESP